MHVRMTLETKYARLRQPVSVGERIDGWRVSWVGGWDRCKVFFVVMLVRVKPKSVGLRRAGQHTRLSRLLRPLPGDLLECATVAFEPCLLAA